MLFILIVVTSVYISFKDITERRIPNATQYLLLLIGFMYHMINGSVATGWISLNIPVSILLVGALLSKLGVIGFGDVKLIFTASLLITSECYYGAMMFIVFLGGAWSILWHFILSKMTFIKKIDRVGLGVPYAIPIVSGLCLFTYVS